MITFNLGYLGYFWFIFNELGLFWITKVYLAFFSYSYLIMADLGGTLLISDFYAFYLFLCFLDDLVELYKKNLILFNLG